MKQRLAVKIEKDNTLVATVFYQHSASTADSMRVLKYLVEYLETVDLKKDFIPGLIHRIEKQSGGINEDEYKSISEKYPCEKFAENPDSNHGLVFIDDEKTIEFGQLTDNIVHIEINTRRHAALQLVYNFTYKHIYESFDSVKEYYEKLTGEDFLISEDDIPESKINPECIQWIDIGIMADFIQRVSLSPCFIKYNGSYYQISK